MKKKRLVLLPLMAATIISGCDMGISATSKQNDDSPIHQSDESASTYEYDIPDVVVPYRAGQNKELTENERGTIGLFSDEVSSWGEFMDIGQIPMEEMDSTYVRSGVPPLMSGELARPELIVCDDERATIVIYSKYIYEREGSSLDNTGLAIAFKNNTSDQRLALICESNSTYGAAVYADGSPVWASAHMQLDAGKWTICDFNIGQWGEVYTESLALDIFENAVIRGTLSLTDGDETWSYDFSIDS